MKKTLKRLFASLMVAVIVLTAAPLSGFVGLELPDFGSIFSTKADAATYGFYTYQINDDGMSVTITDCDTSVSGGIVIPSVIDGYSVTCIGHNAFEYCNKLVSVSVPDSVLNIGMMAFAYCESLENITLPDSITNIGCDAFACTGYYNNDSNWEKGVLYVGDYLVEAKEDIPGEYEIKMGTRCIAALAFECCTLLTNVKFPSSVTSICEWAFSGCDNLTNITVPDSVTSIGAYAFSYCGSLTSITITDNFDSIESGMFAYCDSLTDIILPDRVTSIGDFAFANCDSFTSIVIPENVTSIGEEAFCDCDSLADVTIPDSVTSIGDLAFEGCDSLTDIYYYGTEEQWNEITIGLYIEPSLDEIVHFNSSANNNSYKVGDIIKFGSYPQSEVTDTTLLSKLNSLSLSWISYGYYSGTGDPDDGQMKPSDYMKYADVTYKGDRYRAVTFTEYRPRLTGERNPSSAFQNRNGYYKNTVYWFRFEPLEWRVLDPAEGLVMCESIIDSQPYNNTVYYYNGEYYKNTSCTTYVNDYAESSIRDWLNDDFYHTAFTSSQKAEIKTTTCDNSSHYDSTYDSETTNDKVFLLSCWDVFNTNYGFSSSYSDYDTDRRAQGTDYAKAQGLCVDSSGTYSGNSNWWLRTPGSFSYDACIVYNDGLVDCDGLIVNYSYDGVRPALKINLQSVTNPDTPNDFTESIKLGADRFSFGQDITGTAGDNLNTLLVYTSKENDINDLTITSSNPAIATVGAPNVDKGDYITGENEFRATLPITLKSPGTATITITAPNGTSASVLMVVYTPVTDDAEVKSYINEHISFVNSGEYVHRTANSGFYNAIWQHEEGSSNFTRYAVWDVIGRVGKFAALDLYGTFHVDNPYDVLLADVFSNYVNNEYGKSAEVFENTAKTILGAPSVATDILGALNTAETMDKNYITASRDFILKTQKDWVNGVFVTEENFQLNSSNPEVKALYDSFAKSIKGLDETKLRKVFKDLNNTSMVFDYIGTGADMVFRFFDAYQKYLLAEALCETNEYILASLDMVARFKMEEKNSQLLLDALDPYWSACYTDSAFEIVNKFAAEHGFMWSGVDTIFKYLGANLAREFVHKWIFSATGISYNTLVATYNLTYFCLDYLSGLGKLDETHTLMNAAALLEKEYLELIKADANELKNNATLENAVRFDASWGFLQSLEGYCYKTLSTYISAMKKEYNTNYVIKNSAANNLFYTLLSTNQLAKDLTACDAGIQSAVQMESNWVNFNCHNGYYSLSNLMTVKCPTDVYVYDAEGNLVLSIVDNKVTNRKSNIVAFVDGDEKIFVLPTDQEYDIKITATDDGTMQYSVQSFKDFELLRTVIYNDIELADNKSYTGSIPTELDVPTNEYNLKSEAGAEIEADYDSSEDISESEPDPEPEIKGKVHSVSINDISMSYKDSATVTPSINADSGVKYTVSYSSSNTDVVSIDSNGRVTTNDKGSATITVTVTDEYGNTVTDTCNVNVSYKWWQWIIVIVLFGWIWY